MIGTKFFYDPRHKKIWFLSQPPLKSRAKQNEWSLNLKYELLFNFLENEIRDGKTVYQTGHWTLTDP